MKILIADDNRDFCTTLADIISSEGWSCDICNDPEEVLTYLARHHASISMMLLDIEFNHPTLTGLDVLAQSMRKYPRIPIVMITGVGTIETAVKATQLGAVNFIPKSSISEEKLKEVLYTAMERVNAQTASEEIDEVMRENGIIGTSKAMRSVADNIYRYGRTELSVLITGETGTGKKLVAQALHSVSRRSGNRLITVDIPNIPASLFQSELFGHVKGAFSDAREDKSGMFQQANKGTLFLDEIGDLTPELQPNLLLPIEEKTVRRLGSVQPERIDVRVISATDKNLLEAIREGRFREQLYHRLRECEIHLPPLRERREDIPLIVEYYVSRHNEQMEEQKFLSAAALEFIQDLSWRGNIRELANLIRVVLQTTTNDRVEISDISRVAPPTLVETPSSPTEVMFDSGNTLREDVTLLNKLKIQDTLQKCSGNVSKASAVLGISRETLHNRIKKYEIDVQQYRKK